MAVLKPEKPTPEPGQSWGLFGGAFDPIHYGHLALAQDIQAELNLTGVLFVPTSTPQHRNGQCEASFDDRGAMIEQAIAHIPGFTCSTIERDEALSGYTIDTIMALKRKYPGVSWYLLVGADHASTFDTWYHPDEVLSEITLVIGSRPGFEGKLPDSLKSNKNVINVRSRLVDLSATGVRNLLSAKVPVDRIYDLVPPAVARYIKTHRLYRS